mmetsp:Transcript_4320/g.9121  ORF Transcript_4320/g.9121 Transcript_4320/m.9121 type:complete len:232 (+) Transcript_4320:487-1182(+)
MKSIPKRYTTFRHVLNCIIDPSRTVEEGQGQAVHVCNLLLEVLCQGINPVPNDRIDLVPPCIREIRHHVLHPECLGKVELQHRRPDPVLRPEAPVGGADPPSGPVHRKPGTRGAVINPEPKQGRQRGGHPGPYLPHEVPARLLGRHCPFVDVRPFVRTLPLQGAGPVRSPVRSCPDVVVEPEGCALVVPRHDVHDVRQVQRGPGLHPEGHAVRLVPACGVVGVLGREVWVV